MENLFKETKKMLEVCHKTPKDEVWIGTYKGTEFITWTEFTKLANFDYNNDFGAIEIRPDLVVMGKDWWLERHEYDTKEWWEYKELPKLKENPKKLTRLKATPDDQHL